MPLYKGLPLGWIYVFLHHLSQFTDQVLGRRAYKPAPKPFGIAPQAHTGVRIDDIHVRNVDMNRAFVRPIASHVITAIAVRGKKKDQVGVLRIRGYGESLPIRQFLEGSPPGLCHSPGTGVADDGHSLCAFDLRGQIGKDVVNMDRAGRSVQNPDDKYVL